MFRVDSFSDQLVSFGFLFIVIMMWYHNREMNSESEFKSKVNHVIGVCLPSQSASEKYNQEKKAHKHLRTSWILSQNVSDHEILLFWI